MGRSFMMMCLLFMIFKICKSTKKICNVVCAEGELRIINQGEGWGKCALVSQLWAGGWWFGVN